MSAPYCCHKCKDKNFAEFFKAMRMILCSECGNKRCPKASDHDLDCTDSNDPDQTGSVYTTKG